MKTVCGKATADNFSKLAGKKRIKILYISGLTCKGSIISLPTGGWTKFL